jgi:preprotein translocase subunit SecD
MATLSNYRVYPSVVDRSAKFSFDNSIGEFGQVFLFICGLFILAGIIAVSSAGDSGLLILGVIGVVGFFGIKKIIASIMNAIETKEIIANQVTHADIQAKFYTERLNSILTKSEEISNKILPHFEHSAKQCIDKAKFEFSENAFIPFWDKVEDTAKYLEAV